MRIMRRGELGLGVAASTIDSVRRQGERQGKIENLPTNLCRRRWMGKAFQSLTTPGRLLICMCLRKTCRVLARCGSWVDGRLCCWCSTVLDCTLSRSKGMFKVAGCRVQGYRAQQAPVAAITLGDRWIIRTVAACHSLLQGLCIRGTHILMK